MASRPARQFALIARRNKRHECPNRNETQNNESAAGTVEIRTVAMARLYSPEPDFERRVEAPDRAGRLGGRYVEPGDFREGDHGQHGLHGRSARIAKAQGPGRHGYLRDPGDQRYPGRGRYAETRLRSHQDARRLRESRSFAVSGERYRWND